MRPGRRLPRAVCVLIAVMFVAAGNLALPAVAEAAPVSAVSVDVHVVLGVATTEIRKGLTNDGPSETWFALTLSVPSRALPTRLALEHAGALVEEAHISAANATPPAINASGTWLAAIPPNATAAAVGTNPLSIAARVPAHSNVTLLVAWQEEMRLTRGAYRYRLPLEGLAPSDAFSLGARIEMPTSIREVVTSGASISVSGQGTANVTATAQAQALPAKRGSLYLNFTVNASGMRGLATYCLAAAGGYFTYAFFPEALGLALEPLPKSIAFAIDFSGSMAGDKEKQAKAAFSGILNQLNPEDRFEVVRFDTYVLSLTNGLEPATPDNIATAIDRINGQRSSGATNIGEVLQTTLRDLSRESDRITALVLFTDGTPTVGVRDPEQILTLANDSNTGGAQIHTLALGFEASSQLLERLAGSTGGTYRFIDPSADVVQQISEFYGEISLPLIQNLDVRFSEPAYNVSVPDLAVLYNGAEITAHGQLRPGGGTVHVDIEGTSSRGSFALTDEFTAAAAPDCAAQERALALARIEDALDALRAGTAPPNATADVVDMALDSGFVTPYTPFTLASGDHLTTQEPPTPPGPAPPPEGPIEILVNAPLTGLTIFAIAVAAMVGGVRALAHRRADEELEK